MEIISVKCVLCDEELLGYSNNPWPLENAMYGGCCGKCNTEKVIPARIKLLNDVPQNGS